MRDLEHNLMANRETEEKRDKQLKDHEDRLRKINALAIREIQFKTTMRYHLIPVRMVKINNKRNKCLRGCG